MVLLDHLFINCVVRQNIQHTNMLLHSWYVLTSTKNAGSSNACGIAVQKNVLSLWAGIRLHLPQRFVFGITLITDLFGGF